MLSCYLQRLCVTDIWQPDWSDGCMLTQHWLTSAVTTVVSFLIFISQQHIRAGWVSVSWCLPRACWEGQLFSELSHCQLLCMPSKHLHQLDFVICALCPDTEWPSWRVVRHPLRRHKLQMLVVLLRVVDAFVKCGLAGTINIPALWTISHWKWFEGPQRIVSESRRLRLLIIALL